MEKTCKKISWLVFVSAIMVVVGTIFGILAGVEAGKIGSGDGYVVAKYAIIAVALIAGIVAIITGVITFFSVRKGNVKNAIVATGRDSTVQGIGPLACFILAIIGCVNSGKSFNDIGGLLIFVIVAYVIVLFVTGMLLKGLRGFRKDKENYSYIKIISILSVVFLVIFMVATMITMFKVPSAGETYLVGFIEVFAILFVVSNIIAYIALAIVAGVAEKNAPKTTVADADAETLHKMASDISDMKNAKSVGQVDNVAKLREYKKLMDEGVITKEEFEAKKKELL